MLSIVIPAFNEVSAIHEVVESCFTTFRQRGIAPLEIVVVDDGSSDGTADRAKTAGATVFRHATNLGYGKALKTGIKRATYDCIATLDADGSYRAEDLVAAMKKFEEGFDLVVGLRNHGNTGEGGGKGFLRLALKRLVEFTTGQPVPDPNSGLRIFSRDLVLQYLPDLCDTYSFSTSQTLAYLLTKQCVTYVPITYEKRIGKSKVKLFRDSLRTTQYIVQAIVRYNPIKLFLLVSMTSLSVSACVLIIGVVAASPGIVALAVASCSAAVLIFAMGLLAEQLRQANTAPPK